MKIGKKGFTLVEVIVAIALIGIIAVGIIPAFAIQLKMTINTRNLTSTVFDAQGAMEDDINTFKEVIKENGLFSGGSPTTFRIFDRDVPLYQISKEFPLNTNKSFIVFLSEKLAEMEYRDPLVASLVRIDGEDNSGTKSEGIEVASVRSSSNLKLVKGTFTIEDYTSSQDLNLYRWYRSEEGFADPKFPDNYELVEVWRNKKSLTKAELQQYAANRYIMLSFIPVDKSGVRGDEKPSINRVYIQGEEWRSGIFAWVDKNEDASYDTENDVEVKYAVSKSNWILLRGFNSQAPFPDSGDPDIMLDPSNGSLYVPMGVERSQNIDRAGLIVVSEPGEVIDW
ncbi:MAG TPA: type II secretion system protein, partial [Anaerovoracaceae bacterium]|nr:type II secretion system protein [Anaerovoracaceae bacterium]